MNPRQGRFAKLPTAALLFLIYFLVQMVLKSLGSGGKVNLSIVMPIVSSVFLLIGIVLNSWDTRTISALRYRLQGKK